MAQRPAVLVHLIFVLLGVMEVEGDVVNPMLERLGHDASNGLGALVSDPSQWVFIQLAVDYAESTVSREGLKRQRIWSYCRVCPRKSVLVTRRDN